MTPLKTSLLAASAALLALAATAAARPPHDDDGDRPRPPRRPPPEAIAACDGADVGDPCSFDTPRGDELSGTCQVAGPDELLVCVPAGHRPPPPPDDED